MSKQAQRANLAEVKSMLANKYLRRAQTSNSTPERKRLLHLVEKYRRQVAQLQGR